jgi:hypothetical protein
MHAGCSLAADGGAASQGQQGQQGRHLAGMPGCLGRLACCGSGPTHIQFSAGLNVLRLMRLDREIVAHMSVSQLASGKFTIVRSCVAACSATAVEHDGSARRGTGHKYVLYRDC